jgi:hypothetical protein
MPSADYLVRTKANVVDSDVTVIFTCGELDGGSLKTDQFAVKHKKPHLHVNLDKLSRPESVQAVVKWLQEACPAECALNVAGSRASKAPGIQQSVMMRMVDVISQVNGTLFFSIQD